MTAMQVLAAVIVVVTLAAIVSGRAPAVLCLICALIVAGFAGIAKPSELFAGLSNGGVITIAAMLVIAKGVFYTGVVSRVMYRLLSGVDSVRGTLVRLIPPVGVLSALINTTPIMAMLIPATKELEQQSGIPARGVLLPIAHATTLAGSATLIGTSSNLLIGGIANSIGWTAGEFGIERTPEFQLQKIRRVGEKVPAGARLEAGDVLIYRATEDGVRMLWGSPRFGLARQDLFLVSVSGDETAAIRDLEENEDIMVVAAQTTKSLRKSATRPGEMCLVSAPSADVLADNPTVGLWQKVAGKAPQTGKTTAALVILLGVILASSFGIAPVELIAVTGATLMVLTRVLTPRSAARALNWNILAIIAGSIGLGTIVVKSGLGETISSAIIRLSGGQAVLVALVFALVTTLLTNVVTNAAAAAILTPVAITVAADAGLNPVVLLTLIGTCISLTFLNPIAHQTNLMVMGPGGYSTKTFVRFGIPVTVVTLAVSVFMGFTLLT